MLLGMFAPAFCSNPLIKLTHPSIRIGAAAIIVTNAVTTQRFATISLFIANGTPLAGACAQLTLLAIQPDIPQDISILKSMEYIGIKTIEYKDY